MKGLSSPRHAWPAHCVTAVVVFFAASCLFARLPIFKQTLTTSDFVRVPRQAASAAVPNSCLCQILEPAVLNRHCALAAGDWPTGNEQLVTRCMDFLAFNHQVYLRESHNNSTATCTQQLLLHTFWSGNVTWKLKTVIQSFLFNHFTNDTTCRPKPVLHVWLQGVEPTRQRVTQWAQEWDAPYLACSDQLAFHSWRPDTWLDWLPAELMSVAGLYDKDARTRLRAAIRTAQGSRSVVAFSDAVRFLVLYHFGGIYTDGDVLYLRNLEPLGHMDFIYEWSFVRGGHNTAVCGARKQSPFAAAVIQNALSVAVKVNTSGEVTFDAHRFAREFHPMHVLRRIPAETAKQVIVLPSIPFDPLWLTIDTPNGTTHNITRLHRVRAWREFFAAPKPHTLHPAVATEVFKGAFTHHWHNQWDAPLVPSSMIGRLVEVYNSFFRSVRANVYGIWYTPCRNAETTGGAG